MRPVDALDRHAAGSMTLWPPTWVTLHGLQGAASVDEALAELRSGDVKPVRRARSATTAARSSGRRTTSTRPQQHRQENRPRSSDDGPDAEGNQHRLVMDRLPWIYVNTMGAGF